MLGFQGARTEPRAMTDHEGGLLANRREERHSETLVPGQQASMAPKAKQSKAAGPELARGIGREGRSKTYKRRGLWAIKKKNGGKFPVHEKMEKVAEPEGKVWDRGCTLEHN